MRVVQPFDVVGRELGGERVRRHARVVQDLVGIGVADAREHGLIAQEPLHLRATPREDLGEVVEREVGGGGVGAEPRDARHLGGVAHDVDGERLLGARLGEVESGAVVEAHAQRDGRLPRPDDGLRQLVVPAEPPRAREVEHEVQAARIEIDELAVAGCRVDRATRELLQRRVEGLQRRDRGDRRRRDRTTDRTLAEEPHQRIDLGQFGHPAIVSPTGVTCTRLGTIDRVIQPVLIADDLLLRPLDTSDSAALAVAYRRNREHLAAWEPLRGESFFTTEGQAADVDAQLQSAGSGASVPLVLVDASAGTIVGRATLSGLVRGPFQSANLGYWIDEALNGRGLATAVVGAVVVASRGELGLHRLQAATLRHNAASQRVLERNGFERIGSAPRYLKIAGRWQDHDLFQRILHD